MCVVCGCGNTGGRDAFIAWVMSEPKAVHAYWPDQPRVLALAEE
jgi:hypothetical protein